MSAPPKRIPSNSLPLLLLVMPVLVPKDPKGVITTGFDLQDHLVLATISVYDS